MMYIIKRNSWHYKFNKKLLTRYKSMPNNFCSYWSLTIFHFFKALVTAIPIIAIVGLISSAVYLDPFGSMLAFVILFTFISFAFGTAYLFIEVIPNKIKTSKDKNTEKQPGLIRMKYLSWKEQHCSPIKYVD